MNESMQNANPHGVSKQTSWLCSKSREETERPSIKGHSTRVEELLCEMKSLLEQIKVLLSEKK